jgi:large subunit ribosomal protein L18
MDNFTRRKLRSRYKIRSKNTSKRPIIIVNRSNKHFYLQLISMDGNVITSFSSLNLNNDFKEKSGNEIADIVAKEFSKKCKEKGVEVAVFDKGPYSYGGRVKVAYECCKSNGLKI